MSAQAELERKLSSLVKQRMAGFDYMRRVGTGERHWLSAVSLGDQEAGLAKAVDPDVVLKWYFLGLSFAPLLQLASGATVTARPRASASVAGAVRQPARRAAAPHASSLAAESPRPAARSERVSQASWLPGT